MISTLEDRCAAAVLAFRPRDRTLSRGDLYASMLRSCRRNPALIPAPALAARIHRLQRIDASRKKHGRKGANGLTGEHRQFCEFAETDDVGHTPPVVPEVFPPDLVSIAARDLDARERAIVFALIIDDEPSETLRDLWGVGISQISNIKRRALDKMRRAIDQHFPQIKSEIAA